MKESLISLDIQEKEVTVGKDGAKTVKLLGLWDDNYINDFYMEDTLGISIKECLVKENGNVDETKDDISFTGFWLTKYQCIILRNYLDSFIQLAETIEELT
jgi:hypothetical protein